MSLICAISNEVPEVPVVSPVSGSVFEKRLLEKYLAENGTDPLNGKPLSIDDCIEVKVPNVAKPRPPSATSIPAILKIFQDEWDAVMLNSFTLRHNLHTARQELSHALYQHDAACRVIARQTKEMAAAREALATLKPHANVPQVVPTLPQQPTQIAAVQPSPQVLPAEGISQDVIDKITASNAQLTSERKQRSKTVPPNLAPTENIQSYHQIASHIGLHSTSMPGILSLDLSPSNPAKLVTGGVDKNAVVFDKDSQQIVAILKGHTKKVSSVIYHPQEDTVISASPDETIRIWNIDKAQCTQVLQVHDSAVMDISLHPTGEFILSVAQSGHWAFSDITQGRCLARVPPQEKNESFTCGRFHPDGLIFGTGTKSSLVKIWDLKEKNKVADFEGHEGAITSLVFSENGFQLATSATDGCVKLWDLRRLDNFHTIVKPFDSYEVCNLHFDRSGRYLAICGSDIRTYLVRGKQAHELKTFSDHTAQTTCVRWGQDAQFLASVSMDRSLKFFGL